MVWKNGNHTIQAGIGLYDTELSVIQHAVTSAGIITTQALQPTLTFFPGTAGFAVILIEKRSHWPWLCSSPVGNGISFLYGVVKHLVLCELLEHRKGFGQ